MNPGDRVIMLRYDGWASRGWIGTIADIRMGGNSLSIKWDNGKHLAHKAKDVTILNSENDPNVAFRIHKFEDRRKK